MIRGQSHTNITGGSKDRHLTVDSGTSCDTSHQGEQALLPSSITHVSHDYIIILYTLDFAVTSLSMIFPLLG